MSLTNTRYKGIFNSDVHPFAFENIVHGSGFGGGKFVERYNGDIIKKTLDKVCFPAYLDSKHKFINRNGRYVDAGLDIVFLKKLGSWSPLFEVVDDDVRIYKDFGDFHFSHALRSSLIGLSMSMSLKAPSRAKKSFVSLVIKTAFLFTVTSTFSPSVRPRSSIRYLGKATAFFLPTFTVSIFFFLFQGYSTGKDYVKFAV